MVRRNFVVVAIAAIALLALSSGNSGVALALPSTESDLVPESEASRFRGELGFASDAATVARSYEDRRQYPRTDFGLPLSEIEYQEVLRRAGVQHALAPAIEVATKEATFGGAYMDQRAGGVPVFTFTDDPTAYAMGIAAALPVDVEFRLEQVDYTFAELREKQARISSRWKELEADGGGRHIYRTS